MKRLLIVLFFASFLGGVFTSSAQNLALNKPYTLSERPNYPTTAPSGDRKSLTDGTYAQPFHQGKKRYWLQKSFLGWNYKKQVKINIDLEKVSTINSVVFSTAANGNVQYFPEHVYAFFSLNGQDYDFVGDIAAVVYPPHDKPRRLKIVLNKIHQKARFVTLVVIPHKDKLFCDEIEVRADNYEVSEEDVLYAKPHKYTLSKVFTNLSVEKNNQTNVLKSSLKNQHVSKLISENKYSFVVNKVNPWKPINELFTPKAMGDKLKYNYIIPINGGQYGAFTLTNTSSKRKTIKITHIGTKYFNLDLFAVPFIKNGHGGRVADPLMPVSENLQLSPGETRLLFIELTGLKEGKGESKIKLIGGDREVELDIEAEVKAIFSRKNPFDLNVNVWAYLNVPTLKNSKKAAVKDLEEHHVNTAMIEPWFLPSIRSNDFSELLDYLNNYDCIGNIFLRLRYEQKLPPNFLSKNWKENFKRWYINLSKAVYNNGFPEAKIYFYPYDEISKESHIKNYKSLINWARKAVPNIKFVATFNKKHAIDELLPLVDVGIIYGGKDLFNNLPKTQAEIWTYLVNGNARLKSPYKQYRLMGWKAFYNDRAGIGFWNYSIIKGAKLNKIENKVKLPSKNYAAIYNGADNSLISSRRWEAFKLGIEDYQILKQYAQKYGMKKAKKMADSVIEHPNNYQLADKIRLEMLKKL